ncbi:MAG: hypothetical protein WC515_02595 [Candidatus Omnitrophota bacterium]
MRTGKRQKDKEDKNRYEKPVLKKYKKIKQIFGVIPPGNAAVVSL